MTDSSDEQKKIAGLLMLAEQSAQANNHEEAINFYNKALEIDPTNHTAWFGKAQAAGWSSTVGNVRLLEMVKGISNAISFCPEDRKSDMRVEGAAAITNVANAVFSASYKFYNADPANSRKIVWPAFEQCLRALDTTHEFNPKSIKLMESILIFVNNLGPVFGGSDAQKSLAKDLEVKYGALIKELDPNHKIPTSGCFVVTATMGSEDNIFVADFRYLRDSLLAKSKYGRAFSKIYYTYGPYPANFIRKSIVLRLIAFVLIVLPAYFFVKPILFVADKFKKI